MGSAAISIPAVEILDELGRGAHNIVYRARRRGRYCAVKVPLDTQDQGAPLAPRFVREAVALARVRHPALPSVMEVGTSGRVPYIIMELVAGETLVERLHRGPFEEGHVLELGIQLADAVVQIHAAGLVHRDISAANILFDSLTAAVRLIDFGFVRDSPEGFAVDDKDGPSVPGSEVRPRNDIQGDLRALGCVLFQCATGTTPFSEVDPRPVLERNGERLGVGPQISPHLSSVLRRLLLLDPASPYLEASAVAADLRRISAGLPPQSVDAAAAHRPFEQGTSLPLLGRQRELTRLRSALRASTTGHAQIVVVRGPAGSGKTRLLRAMLDTARETHRCLAASCEQSQREPLSAIRKLIEAQVAEYDSLPAADRLRAIARFRSLASGVEAMLRLLSAKLRLLLAEGPIPAPEQAVGLVSNEVLAGFLAKLWNEGPPRVVMVDDVQWLDAGSRRVLGHLSDVKDVHVLYLFAGRDDKSSWPAFSQLLRAVDAERLWEVALETLDEEHTAAFLRAYLVTDQVDDDLVRYVFGLSDGTPLGIIEVLRSVLEGGALVPYWGAWKFDFQTASRLDLPRGALELLIRRTEQLGRLALVALTTAAAIGMSFEDELLARASGLTADELAPALSEARHAMLLEARAHGHQFLHDAVREAFLARLEPLALRQIHQRIAEALDREQSATARLSREQEPLLIRIADRSNGEALELDLGTENPEQQRAAHQVHALASHFAEGQLEKHPQRSFEVCLLAGNLAFRTFDNDLALRFFDVAREAATLAGVELSPDFELTAAEAQLRTGALENALKRLAVVAANAPDPVTRARALSRTAWAEMQIDVDRAWAALFSAFEILGARAPSGSFAGLAVAIVSWLWWLVSPAPRRRVAAKHRPRLQVLCQLNDQAARLAADTGKPRRLLHAVLSNLRQAERLGPSTALCTAYLLYSFVLTVLGFHRAGQRYIRSAESIARVTKDPAVYARLLQIHAAITAWAGDTREAVAIGARSLEEYGHWRELSEYCLTAYNQQQIENVRGRCFEAWRYLEHAINKLVRHEGPAMALEFIEHSVRAALLTLGRGKDAQPLLRRLSTVTTRPPSRGALIITSYGSRVRIFTECGDLGEPFENLVSEVDALALNPRNVHLEVLEYYVHVAHARVHACLRAREGERSPLLPPLRKALRELRLAARIPLVQAHAEVVAAYSSFFDGHLAKANALFDRAYELATQEGAPWVGYAVHRGRAHLLRAQGIFDSALDQARAAEALAREHGAAYRLRWIREEFALKLAGLQDSRDFSPVSSPIWPSFEYHGPHSRPRPRSYLKSLVRIGQHTAREFGLVQQARHVLSELIEATRADRGFLFLSPERLAQERDALNEVDGATDALFPSASPSTRMIPIAARSAGGADLPHATDYDQRIIEDALSSGERQADEASLPTVVCVPHDDRTVLAASLVVRGERMGAVYLDRPFHVGAFTEADARALAALAIQVPLVFELARFLTDRERAEETQRSTEKLEAIGRLAGGIAHDFNNMLSVILGVTDQILTQRSTRAITDDVRTVQSAAERARDLTRQLLAFSRGQYLRPEVLQLNDLAQRLEPIFRQLLGERIELVLNLDPTLCLVKADPAQIDQVLTNLIVNARDAMLDGGSLIIESGNLMVAAGRDAEHLGVPPGRYARLSVIDSGTGMTPATLAKLFEPFFTTKTTGSGLGLPTAYGIIKQSGGHIDVDSRLGSGTTFRILLPETEQRLSQPAPALRPSDRPGRETVLLVDDEPLVREATRRTLRSLGYQVIGAKSADDALKLAAEHATTIDLVITDVMMPGMNGLELARELGKLRPSLKVLFISGYTAGVLAERGFLRESVDFVQKPVARDALAARIRELLDGRPAPS
jgi:signal transduction histidine kinase/ActR/RegA family two-component response regulator/tRNA A-37 threonylcarbamoyl transferase component Bud32/tetratricopeptide (TPR) repeat protein